MNHATMHIGSGVEVNLARQALRRYMSAADARALIPSEGGYIGNIFNNERGRDIATWIEAIHSEIHENRERHRAQARERQARAKGEIICPQCDGQGKPSTARASTSWGNSYEETVCRFCGATLE